MATHTLRPTVNVGGREIGAAVDATYSGTGGSFIDGETVATAQTDSLINIAIDVSAVKSFILVSTQAVTIETNSGSAADDTIVLKANKPYIWNTDSYDSFLLGTDVTAFYVTNASGATATIHCFQVCDATPA